MPKRLTQEDFIRDSIKIHGDKYGYDRVVYVNSTTNVEIYCKKHSKYFTQRAINHRLLGTGCKLCGNESSAEKRVSGKELFELKAREIHGDKYLYDNVVYKNNRTKVDIYCKRHKIIFQQNPDDHLSQKGCKLCGWEKRTSVHQYTTEIFIQKAIKKHGNNLYDYSKVKYKDSVTPVEIICKTANKSFMQAPVNHLTGSGSPYLNESKGERCIRLYLENQNINHKPQKVFNTLRWFRFDFFLPDYNLIIEYQGEQHFNPIEFFGGVSGLLSTAKRDVVKKHYCLNNNINFLEIPYWEKDNIPTILSNALSI